MNRNSLFIFLAIVWLLFIAFLIRVYATCAPHF